VEVLSPPKSSANTALLESVLLYIKAPRAVIVAEVHDALLKSANAVVPEVVGVILVRAVPPAVYPVPDASFVDEYAVVAALKVTLLVYKATLKVSPEDAVKL
jgi:hypothetical protein